MPKRPATTPPGGFVLVLPGGRPESTARARWWQPASLRMVPFTAALSAQLGSAVRVRQLRYRYRGWNGERCDPVHDGIQALARARRDFGPVAVALVGHSMGGRAAAHLAAWPHVRAVVALAPWWPAADVNAIPDGVNLLVVHGLTDRRTSAADSHRQVMRAQARGLAAGWIGIAGSGHAMLRHRQRWQRATTTFVARELLGAQ